MGKGAGKGAMHKERTYSFDEEAPPDDTNSPKFIYSRSISAAVYLAHVRRTAAATLELPLFDAPPHALTTTLSSAVFTSASAWWR